MTNKAPHEDHHQRINTLLTQREHAHQTGNQEQAAQCDRELGIIHVRVGDYNKARTHFHAAKTVFTTLHMPKEAAACDVALGYVHKQLDEFEKARGRYQAAKTVFTELAQDKEIAGCDVFLGYLNKQLGEFEKARGRFDAAKEVYVNLGLLKDAALCDLSLAMLNRKLGDYRQARADLKAARTAFTKLGLRNEVAGCDLELGNVYLEFGEFEEARGRYQAAKTVFTELAQDKEIATCDLNLGNVHLRLGEYAKARESYWAAKGVFTELRMPKDVALCDIDLGLVDLALGEFEEARDSLATARRVFTASAMWVFVAQVDVADGTCLAVWADHVEDEGDAVKAEVLRREALGLLVPAVLALDAVRFQLDNTPARQRWAESRVASGMNTALTLAQALGDTDLLAELIESSRAFGRLDLPDTDELSTDAAGLWLTASTPHPPTTDQPQRGHTNRPDTDGSPGPTPTLSPALPVQTTHPRGLRLQPPGRVHLPWQPHPALTDHHHTAQQRYGHTNTTTRPIYPLTNTLT